MRLVDKAEVEVEASAAWAGGYVTGRGVAAALCEAEGRGPKMSRREEERGIFNEACLP